jgi:hypothetical protein
VLVACFMLISCLAYSLTLIMEVACCSERPLTFDGLHGIVSQGREVYENIRSNISILFSQLCQCLQKAIYLYVTERNSYALWSKEWLAVVVDLCWAESASPLLARPLLAKGWTACSWTKCILSLARNQPYLNVAVPAPHADGSNCHYWD